MFTRDEIDQHLVGLLADEVTSASGPAFPVEVRSRCIREALSAIGGALPWAVAKVVALPYEADSQGFALSTEMGQVLAIHGLRTADMAAGFKPLNLKTPEEMRDDNLCWLGDLGREPTTAVWSATSPRIVWVDGEVDPADKVVVTASLLTQGLNAGDTYEYDRRIIPAVIDYAMFRVLSREDTAANLRQQYFGQYGQQIQQLASAFASINPSLS